MGQGQPRVIILTVFVVLSYHMLHTQFQGHQSYLVLEKKIFKFLPYMGVADMLVMQPGCLNKF